jgi:DNA-binding XRE family transcriptional regulator
VKSFGTYVKKLRADKGLLQRKLGIEIGVTENTVVNWEKDRTLPSKKWTKLLGRYMGVRESRLEKRSVD